MDYCVSDFHHRYGGVFPCDLHSEIQQAIGCIEASRTEHEEVLKGDTPAPARVEGKGASQKHPLMARFRLRGGTEHRREFSALRVRRGLAPSERAVRGWPSETFPGVISSPFCQCPKGNHPFFEAKTRLL